MALAVKDEASTTSLKVRNRVAVFISKTNDTSLGLRVSMLKIVTCRLVIVSSTGLPEVSSIAPICTSKKQSANDVQSELDVFTSLMSGLMREIMMDCLLLSAYITSPPVRE